MIKYSDSQNTAKQVLGFMGVIWGLSQGVITRSPGMPESPRLPVEFRTE